MDSFLHKLQTAARLVGGALSGRASKSDWKSVDTTGFGHISFDCFGTVLARLDPDWEQRAIAGILGSLVQPGSAFDAAVADSRRAVDGDPECSSLAIWERYCSLVGLAPEFANAIHAVELEALAATTSSNTAAMTIVEQALAAGKKVSLCSDSRFGAGDLAALLGKSGIDRFPASSIHSSCDHARGKFRGGLHRLSKDFAGCQLLHIGDDRLADGFSAAAEGISARVVPAAETEPGQDRCSRAFRLGFSELGPVFALFCLKLFALLPSDQPSGRFVFVARDGWFLKMCAEAWSREVFDRDDTFGYSLIPRCRARLASIMTPADAVSALGDAREVKAAAMGPVQAAAWLGVEFSNLFPGCSPDDYSLLEFESEVAGVRFPVLAKIAGETRESLAAELLALGPDFMFVDIGWRGSIGRMFDAAVPAIRTRWAFFARWSERGKENLRLGDVGLVADQESRESLAEKSAWDLYGLLESICKEPSPEQDDPEELLAVRQGILLSLRLIAGAVRHSPANNLVFQDRLKRMSDSRLFRLSHFPGKDAMVLAERLTCEESHSDYSVRLWGRQHVAAWRHPIAWIKGFACPWKGAWAVRTAGLPGGVFWLCCDWIVFKTGLIRLARRLAS